MRVTPAWPVLRDHHPPISCRLLIWSRLFDESTSRREAFAGNFLINNAGLRLPFGVRWLAVAAAQPLAGALRVEMILRLPRRVALGRRRLGLTSPFCPLLVAIFLEFVSGGRRAIARGHLIAPCPGSRRRPCPWKRTGARRVPARNRHPL